MQMDSCRREGELQEGLVCCAVLECILVTVLPAMETRVFVRNYRCYAVLEGIQESINLLPASSMPFYFYVTHMCNATASSAAPLCRRLRCAEGHPGGHEAARHPAAWSLHLPISPWPPAAYYVSPSGIYEVLTGVQEVLALLASSMVTPSSNITMDGPLLLACHPQAATQCSRASRRA